MTAYRWIHGQKGGGGSIDETSVEWDDHWTCIGYNPPPGEPAAFGLLLDRPEFRHGQRHYNPGILAKVVNFDCDRLSTVKDAWEVVVRYRQELVAKEQNPLELPAEITLDAESEEVPVLEDAEGRPLLSTAGGLIAGITEEETRWIFNFSKNLPGIPRWLLEYRNGVVNNDSVRIGGLTIDAGYLLLKQPRAGKVESASLNGQPVEYVPFSFSLVYHPRTWITRYFNRDLCELKERIESWPNRSDPDGEPRQVKIVERVPCMVPDGEGGFEPAEEPQFLGLDLSLIHI